MISVNREYEAESKYVYLNMAGHLREELEPLLVGRNGEFKLISAYNDTILCNDGSGQWVGTLIFVRR